VVGSAKSASKHQAGACEARWAHYKRSPPTRVGAGSIFFHAKSAEWVDPREPKIFRTVPGQSGNEQPQAAPRPAASNAGTAACAPAASDADDWGPSAIGIAPVGNESPGLVTEGTVAAFVRAHGNKLRYDHSIRRWYVWDRTRWRREETKLAFRWAHEKARALATTANSPKTAVVAGRAAFADGVEKLAQAHRTLAVTHDHWDRDAWLLGTPGGTVDLRTGVMRPASRGDFITKQVAVAPASTADCPQWLKFLRQAARGDKKLIAFLRRYLGSCLTGDTSEHALIFLWGPGGNGKGVLMNTVFDIIGDYSVNAAMDTFTATRGDRHTTDLAMMAGARLVISTEMEEGKEWAEAKVKALTGGDPITARFMHRDNFTFVPRFKLVISGNHKPNLRNVDPAIRRRLHMVPFLNKPKRVDKKLAVKLKQEAPQILRWMIDGCLEWQQIGLKPPPVVMAATEEYFDDQDLMRQWIVECCEVRKEHSDTSENLYRSWSAHCTSNGERPGSTKSFSSALANQGFTRVKDTPNHRSKRGFLGIRVKPQGLFGGP
jgi:putative DNA primase/helicase